MNELKLQQCRLDSRYDIIECLGRGSYAEIYVADDVAAKDGAPSKVVIKALNMFLQSAPDDDLERTLIENFQNEAIALDRVRHPNIISRRGHGTAIDLAGKTFHYIVLEYMPGGDMAALCRSKPLSLERTIYYLEQICAGLTHAHAQRVIHRDIKPQNLLLSADRQIVKIADFGVAKLEASDEAITRVGTDIYAAPEHNPSMRTGQLDTASLRYTRSQLTPAADVYSLAKTTYMLLTGESPRRFAQKQITSLPEEIAHNFWSADVLQALRTATELRAEARHKTVRQFFQEIHDASLAPTMYLGPRPTPSTYVAGGLAKMPEALPKPEFPVSSELDRPYILTHPRIVVPLAPTLPAQAKVEILGSQIRSSPPGADAGVQRIPSDPETPVRRSRTLRVLVTALLLLFLVSMLLATHRFFSERGRNLQTRTTPPPRGMEVPQAGREGTTTTNVNLRPDPSTNNPPIGLAEAGSRVRILRVKDNWCEVEILQHGREKSDPNSSDRGWLNRNYIKFN